MRYQADPITMQVIRYAMEQIADEMGYTLIRTGRSTILKEIGDVSCGVFDPMGRTVAQAHHAPMLLASFEITMKEVVRRFSGDELKEGDVIITNDPYSGGQHVMDVVIITPVHLDGELIGFTGSIAHMTDMGGAAASGVAGGMTEIYEEGLRLPMIHLCREYRECRDIFAIISNNSRVPDKVLGDIRAMISAGYVGARRMREVYTKYGADVMQKCLDMLLDYSERRIREGLRKIPDGFYVGEDYADNDGFSDDPVKVQVNIDKRGDAIRVDFTGTSPQTRGNINSPLATTIGTVYYTVACIADPHAPPNSGCYRPIEIIAPEGTAVNPKIPAGVTARTEISSKIVEAMMKALASAAPDKIVSGSHGQISTCGFSGFHPKTGKRFVYTEIQGGGAPARPGRDGRDGQDSHLTRFKNTPVEAAELEFPVRIEKYEFITDSGGAGKYRGALSMQKDIRFLVDNVSWARYGDRQKFQPFGLLGGKNGTVGEFIVNPGTPWERKEKPKGLTMLRLNDVVSLRLPGSGGLGDPLERDPNLLQADLLDEKVSVESAERDYGVKVDPVTRRIIETRRARVV